MFQFECVCKKVFLCVCVKKNESELIWHESSCSLQKLNFIVKKGVIKNDPA